MYNNYIGGDTLIIGVLVELSNKNIDTILEELKINLEFYLKKLIEGMKINLL